MTKGLFIKYLTVIFCLGWIWTSGAREVLCQNQPPVFSLIPSCNITVPDSEEIMLSGGGPSGEFSGGSFEQGTFNTCHVAEGATLEVRVHATDPDGDLIHLSVIGAPAGAQFSDLGKGEGIFTWTPEYLGPSSSASSPFVIFFVASDESSSAQMRAKIKVANVNRKPEIFVPDSSEVAAGSPLVFQVRTKDLDSEYVDLQISNIPPGMIFNRGTNLFTWTPQMADTGLWTVDFVATDQSGGTSSAQTHINVVPPLTFNLSLGTQESLLGEVVEVPVNLLNTYPVAGLELCVKFNPDEFTFLGVSRAGCKTRNWEYFTYKEKILDQFNVVKIVGIADFPNQYNVLPLAPDSGIIAYLQFKLTSDPYLNGFFLSLEFTSVNFTDNTLSTNRGKFIPRSDINVTNGGVLLSSAGTRVGDINQNGYPFEVGDAVSLAGYLAGSRTLNHQQLINSDVNQDGRMATLSDLVFLIRHIIEGGTAPGGLPAEDGDEAVVRITSEPQKTSVGIDSDTPVGGALVVFKGENLKIENLELTSLAQGLDLYTSRVGDEFRVMVISPEAKTLPLGDGSLFTFKGEGYDTVLISLADQTGKLLKVKQESDPASLPAKFALYQNYPNPFNPETVIKYAVSGNGSTRVSLKVYNVVGQLVKTLVDEEQVPGEYSQPWNGKDEKNEDVASGMYFYKLKVSGYTETKKMVLLR